MNWKTLSISNFMCNNQWRSQDFCWGRGGGSGGAGDFCGGRGSRLLSKQSGTMGWCRAYQDNLRFSYIPDRRKWHFSGSIAAAIKMCNFGEKMQFDTLTNQVCYNLIRIYSKLFRVGEFFGGPRSPVGGTWGAHPPPPQLCHW